MELYVGKGADMPAERRFAQLFVEKTKEEADRKTARFAESLTEMRGAGASVETMVRPPTEEGRPYVGWVAWRQPDPLTPEEEAAVARTLATVRDPDTKGS